MIAIAVGFNVLISLVLLYSAWVIVKLRSRLAKIADKIIAAERTTYKVLHNAPNAISKGQKGALRLGQQYQQLDPQLQRVQQVLGLFSLGRKFWLRGKPKSVATGLRFWRRS